jgi:hypothetical protein
MHKPNVTLTGIEYLLVCIQANPGRSQRYYLRRLYRYKHGETDPTGGSRGVGYFTSESYRGVLWYDAAPKKQSRSNLSRIQAQAFLLAHAFE